ncbi:hypothetical protein IQ13_1473 [Lacibacter cauensis]|uniref:Transposase n=1 Tax=Lacibacter cauensis TaxID=510947 RepID=A0A562SQF7_9BACT|nr:hypothetical protein [Lacibacter cauensis]TWI83363.1 hypothetical protein IQ13_1473 [Lacibacter cauensis]
MDLKEQIIKEYLETDCGYRSLQSKYGISRTTICKWVQIYHGVYGLGRTAKQQNHYPGDMDDWNKKRLPKSKSQLKAVTPYSIINCERTKLVNKLLRYLLLLFGLSVLASLRLKVNYRFFACCQEYFSADSFHVLVLQREIVYTAAYCLHSAVEHVSLSGRCVYC